jgi:hypothetical protein
MGPKTQNGDFLEDGFNDFDTILTIYRDYIPKQNCMIIVFRKIMVRAIGLKTRNANFLGTDFTGETNFIFVRNSATNNGLRRNNEFRFYGKIVKVNHI